MTRAITIAIEVAVIWTALSVAACAVFSVAMKGRRAEGGN